MHSPGLVPSDVAGLSEASHPPNVAGATRATGLPPRLPFTHIYPHFTAFCLPLGIAPLPLPSDYALKQTGDARPRGNLPRNLNACWTSILLCYFLIKTKRLQLGSSHTFVFRSFKVLSVTERRPSRTLTHEQPVRHSVPSDCSELPTGLSSLAGIPAKKSTTDTLRPNSICLNPATRVFLPLGLLIPYNQTNGNALGAWSGRCSGKRFKEKRRS